MTRTKLKIAVLGAKGGWSSELLASRVEERTGYRLLFGFEEVMANLASGELLCDGVDLRGLDAIVMKKLGSQYSASMLDRLEVLRFLAASGVRIFSKPESIARLIDRLSCTVTLRLAGIPMPETVITENLDEGERTVKRFGEAVCKPLYSTKAQGMLLLSGRDPTCRGKLEAFARAGNPVLYLQRKIPELRQDLGVVFLGGKVVGSYLRVRGEGSWNTTVRAGGHYAKAEPTPEVLCLAHRAQASFDMDLTSVDIVETPDGPQVFEVSAFGGFRGLMEASGVDLAALYADYVIAQVNR